MTNGLAAFRAALLAVEWTLHMALPLWAADMALTMAGAICGCGATRPESRGCPGLVSPLDFFSLVQGEDSPQPRVLDCHSSNTPWAWCKVAHAQVCWQSGCRCCTGCP